MRLLTATLAALLSGCVALGGPALPPPDFALGLSEGGGFTGIESGVEVRRDGTVRAWGGVSPVPAQLTADQRAELWTRLREGYHSASAPPTSAVQRTIRIRARGREQTARWVPGTEPDLDLLYQALWAAVRSETAPPA